MIRAQLQGKNAQERANLKGQEIAKLKRVKKTKRKDYDIEIVDMNPIEGGVEVFARAWQNGQQIGFGKDGSVDIERFRIINPPIMVRQKNALVENHKVALLQVIEHNLSVMKNVHGAARIQPGKRGNTTTTVYPAAGENAPVDSRVWRSASESFSAIRTGSGTNVSNTTNANNHAFMRRSSGNWDLMIRSFYGFDTSAIGTDTIDSAVFSLYGTSTVTNNFISSAVVDRVVPDNAAAGATADYNIGNWDGVEQSTARIAFSSWNTSGYNDFTLNATGRGNINGSGYSWYGQRVSQEFDNSDPGSDGTASIIAYYADETGTTNDPKLVVEHSAAVTANPSRLLLLGVG